MSPMSDVSDLSDTMETIKSEQRKFKEKLRDRSSQLRAAATHAEKFQGDLNILQNWLEVTEGKLAGVEVTSTDPEVIARQNREIQGMQTEILKKSRDHETLNHEGEKLMQVTDKDQDVIQKKLDTVNRKWQTVSTGITDKLQQLEDVQQRLNEFTETLDDAKARMEGLEQKLESHNALGPAGKDGKHLEKMTSLMDQVQALQPQITFLSDLVESFSQDSPDGSTSVGDVSMLNASLKDLENQYRSVEDGTQDWITQITAASKDVEEFQGVIRSSASALNDLEEELEHKSAVGRDSNTVQAQMDDTKVS